MQKHDSMFSPFKDQAGRLKATVYIYYVHLRDALVFKERETSATFSAEANLDGGEEKAVKKRSSC